MSSLLMIVAATFSFALVIEKRDSFVICQKFGPNDEVCEGQRCPATARGCGKLICIKKDNGPPEGTCHRPTYDPRVNLDLYVKHQTSGDVAAGSVHQAGDINQATSQHSVFDMLRNAGNGLQVDSQPSGGQPSGEQPSGEQPSGEQPPADKPSGERPSGGKPSGEQPSGGQSSPSGEQPSGGQPSGEQPSGDQPNEDRADGDPPVLDQTTRDTTSIQLPDDASARPWAPAPGSGWPNRDTPVQVWTDTGSLQVATINQETGVQFGNTVSGAVQSTTAQSVIESLNTNEITHFDGI